MVRLKGPILSTEAHGSLQKLLTFADNNGTPSLKKYAKPRDPRTAKQIGTRAMIEYLSKLWKIIPVLDQATWEPLANDLHVAAYHAFIQVNSHRWFNFRAPSIAYPAAETMPMPNVTRPVFYNTYQRLVARYGLPFPVEPFGFTIHLSATTPFQVTRNNCIHVARHTMGASDVVKIQDVPGGTYYQTARGFTADGRWGIPRGPYPCVIPG